MNNEKLTQLKRYYREETLAPSEVDALWEELSEKLPERQYHPYRYIMQYATISLVLVFLFTGTLFAVSEATPNTPLYPVRTLAETAVARMTGQYDSVIQNRTDEIINAAQKKSDAEIEQAAKEYEQTLKEAAKEKQGNKKAGQELKKTLNESENKLRTVTPANAKAKNVIHQSIKATEKTQKDVKGAQTGGNGNGNQGSEHKPENPGNSGNNNSGNNGSQGNQGSQNSGNGNNK